MIDKSTDNWLETVSTNIRKYRKNNGLTQEELAEVADISLSFMGMIERSKRIPSVDTLLKIVKTLNITFNDLFFSDITTTHKSLRLSEKYGTKYAAQPDIIDKRIASLISRLPTSKKRVLLKIIKHLFEK